MSVVNIALKEMAIAVIIVLVPVIITKINNCILIMFSNAFVLFYSYIFFVFNMQFLYGKEKRRLL